MGAPRARLTGPRPRLDRATAAVRAAVRAELADLPGAALVLVACSGGPDSVALALATAFEAPRLGLRAGAVVVDHAWFATSAAVCEAAARGCREAGLDPVDVVRVDVARGSASGGPEAAARTARYRAFAEVADRHGAAAVLLGHTLDDQAETVLLGLTRGSGTRSLAGMPRRRGRYRRPLLDVPRAVTAAAAAAAAASGVAVWSDPANADPAYTRVRARDLLPRLEEGLGPGVVAALARTATLARDDADLLDTLAAELYAAALVPDGPSPAGPGPDVPAPDVTLDVRVLAAAAPALRRRVLLTAARTAGAPAGALGAVHVAALDALVLSPPGHRPAHLPGGASARHRYGRLEFRRPATGDPGLDREE